MHCEILKRFIFDQRGNMSSLEILEDSSLMVGRTKGEFYAIEKKLSDFYVDLKADNILTTVQKLETSISSTFDTISKILIDNGLINSETR